MHAMSNKNSRLMRTLNDLAEYDFQIRYKPEKKNWLADTLSRAQVVPLDSEENSCDLGFLPDGLELLACVDGGGDSLVKSLVSGLRVS